MARVALNNKCGNYGTRVFIDNNEKYPDGFREFMDSRSAWGGSDWHDDEGHEAWELPLCWIAPVFGSILEDKFGVKVVPASELLG